MATGVCSLYQIQHAKEISDLLDGGVASDEHLKDFGGLLKGATGDTANMEKEDNNRSEDKHKEAPQQPKTSQSGTNEGEKLTKEKTKTQKSIGKLIERRTLVEILTTIKRIMRVNNKFTYLFLPRIQFKKKGHGSTMGVGTTMSSDRVHNDAPVQVQLLGIGQVQEENVQEIGSRQGQNWGIKQVQKLCSGAAQCLNSGQDHRLGFEFLQDVTTDLDQMGFGFFQKSSSKKVQVFSSIRVHHKCSE
ncbi:hypothetical protein HAX54_006789 [Datura stramonium]|uniref:Uncharacterized protein n=1 Tax=Datura stramonium TaxID=4076 RepID=A0ABS8WYB8_DATST|nr:hypothetical protein [Datura stramonium]